MNLFNREKISYAIGSGLIVFLCCHVLPSKEKKDELIVNNIHIDRRTCISGMNYTFGRGADSIKICNCLIPQFYNLIRKDSELVKKFRGSMGFFGLQGKLGDSFTSIFNKCVRENILDSNYPIPMHPEDQRYFVEKLQDKLILTDGFKDEDALKISSCVGEKIKGHLTIAQYLSDDYLDSPDIRQMLDDCQKQAEK